MQFTLASPASEVDVLVFTTAFRKVNEKALPDVSEGTTDLPLGLDDRWGRPLADGLYYVVVRAPHDRMIVKLLVLR